MEQMPQPTSLVDSLNMIPKLTEMLNSLSGFGLQQVKPDDPLPDFTKFDKAKVPPHLLLIGNPGNSNLRFSHNSLAGQNRRSFHVLEAAQEPH